MGGDAAEPRRGPAADGAPDPESRTENIWVGVRIRPLNQAERSRREREVWMADPVDARKLSHTESAQSGQHSCFAFDKVWGPDASTEDVYADSCQEIVRSAAQGFNGTIFAYGQTAAGKTYTINSIMKQAAEEIFDLIGNTPGREFTLRLSAVEIYNEVVYDLLHKGGVATLKLLQGDDPEKTAQAPGMEEVNVHSVDHLIDMLAAVDKKRHVGEHNMNERSSRSHLIVRVTLESHAVGSDGHAPITEVGDDTRAEDLLAAIDNPIITSILSFVDLAGSERAARTQAEGVRLKEGCHINRSLLTLGTVIRKLSEGEKGYIPYRDSKLTRMLQNSLGGNSRTAILCTITPSARESEPTRSTVYFAEQAKMIENRAHVNTVLDDKAVLRQLRLEIGRLQAQLAERSRTPSESLVGAALAREREALELKVGAEKRLQGLERFILRAPGHGGALKRRNSWSNQTPLKRPTAPVDVRASWAPGQGLPKMGGLGPPLGGVLGALAEGLPSAHEPPTAAALRPTEGALSRGAGGAGGLLLLDLLRPGLQLARAAAPPGKAAFATVAAAAATATKAAAEEEGEEGRAAADSSPETSLEDPWAGLEEEIQKLTEESLRDASAERALAELQLEVRCFKSAPGGLAGLPASERLDRIREEISDLEARRAAAPPEGGGGAGEDSVSEETLATFRGELARLEGRRECEAAAEGALESLESRLDEMTRQMEKAISFTVGTPIAAPRALAPRRSDGDAGGPTPSPAPRAAGTPTTDGGRSFIRRMERSPSSSPMLGSPTAQDGSSIGGPTPRRTTTPRPGNKENVSPMYSSWTAGDNDSVVLGSTGGKSMGGATPVGPGGGEDRIVGRVRQAVRDFSRMQSDFKAASERDVAAIREALDGAKEDQARLACQKRLLLAQVLALELQVEQGAKERKHVQERLARAHRKVDKARERVKEVERAAATAKGIAGRAHEEAVAAGEHAARAEAGMRAAQATAACATAGQAAGAGVFDADNDSWANNTASLELTPEYLLAEITKMWQELHVPLIHRSRFFLAFRGRDTFYLVAEQRRLAWLRSRADAAGGTAAAAAAAKALKRERALVVQQLARRVDAKERQQLFMSWAVPIESKRRKEQLVGKLWTPAMDAIKTKGKQVACAKLVLRLYGEPEPEEEGAGGEGGAPYDLVFPACHAEGHLGIVDRLRATIGV